MPEKSKKLLFFEAEYGIEVKTAYRDGDKVHSVKFSFPKEVWADLGNKEGNLLGVCCGNISTMRDCFVDAWREDGWMTAESMQQLVVNMESHEWEGSHPASKVKQVYEALLDHLEIRPAFFSDPEELGGTVSRIWFGDIWRFCARYGHDSMFSDWAKSIQSKATHNLRLHEILPTVKLLYEKLAETKFPPVEGYALINKNNQIYEFRNSTLAIFDSKRQAEEILNNWLRSGQVKNEDVEIRLVRISLEKGIEIE
jgi:hypothetical protein